MTQCTMTQCTMTLLPEMSHAYWNTAYNSIHSFARAKVNNIGAGQREVGGGGSVWGPYTRFLEREETRKLNFFFVSSAREEGRTFLHDFVPWSGDLLGGTRVRETESGESEFFSRFVKRNRWSVRSHEERRNCCADSRTISTGWPIVSYTSSKCA
jgi:hypothetical protein